MTEHLQSAIGELAAGVLVQLQVLQLRHPRKLQQAIVGEFARPAKPQAGDMIELRDAP
jgi:hypothetical protein